MTKLLPFCGAALLATLVTASATDFPLQFKTIEAKDVMKFPGGYGSYGQIRIKKPDGLKAEPKAVSKHPLYGKTAQGSDANGYFFRIDESKGDGKGYDQLIVDLNQNGDLTDDPVASVVKTGEERDYGPNGPEFAVFGPMESTKTINGGHPVYFAQAYIYFRVNRSSIQNENIYLGQLRFKAGWYLETTVEMAGLKQKVGIFDANSNQRLGDVPKPTIYNGGDEGESWYFNDGDSLLRDVNGSGKFENDNFSTEYVANGPVVYFGTEPYKVSLAKDCSCLSVERWTDPLAEVSLMPEGKQLSRVILARETGSTWDLLDVGVADGKIKVPPAKYRLYSCQLKVQTAKGEPLGIEGTLRNTKTPVAFEVGGNNVLKCGAPLQVNVQGTKRNIEQWQQDQIPKTPDASQNTDTALAINAKFLGQGGEVYDTFGTGKDLAQNPPKPTFVVTDAKGEKIANGNLEFG